MARAYTGSGAPGAGTLPGGNVTFIKGDEYFDTATGNFWVCDTSGSGSGSHWTQASGTGGGGGGGGGMLNEQSNLSVLNTAAETTLYSYAIAANAMATSLGKQKLTHRLNARFPAGGNSISATLRVYMGATQLFTWSILPAATYDDAIKMIVEYWLLGATNSETAQFMGWTRGGTGNTGAAPFAINETVASGFGMVNGLTIDMTTSQTFKVTVQPSSAFAGVGFDRAYGSLELGSVSGLAVPDTEIVLAVPGDPGAISNASMLIPIARSGHINAVYTTCRGAPSSGTYKYNITDNGVALYTTDANKPTRANADGTGKKTNTLPDTTAVSSGDVLAVNVETAGTGIVDLALVVRIGA